MERHFDQELERVRHRLFEMAGQVEEMIALANRALVERDDDLAGQVIAADAAVDKMEVELDQECLRLLARQEPKGGDLRFLVSVMKMVNDLERIGDSAKNMGKAIQTINEEPPLKPYIDLPHLSRMTREMVAESLDAFMRRDTELARKVIVDDDRVDALYHQLFRELVTYMIEDPKTVRRSLELLLVARNLERIADHATNIAEDVVYYLEAKDIRHTLAKSSGE